VIRRRTAGLVLPLAVLALVVGCTGGDPEPDPSVSPSPSASEEQAPGVTDITDTPGAGTDGAGGGFTGALADAPFTTCERDGDAWRVAGTATNPTEGVVDYRIYVSLLDGAAGTRALQQVDVADVPAGETSEWETEVPVAEDGLNCVLRVERYAA